MRVRMSEIDLARAVAGLAIAGHARLAATPIDQLAMTVAFDVGRAMLRAARQAAGVEENQHAAL